MVSSLCAICLKEQNSSIISDAGGRYTVYIPSKERGSKNVLSKPSATKLRVSSYSELVSVVSK